MRIRYTAFLLFLIGGVMFAFGVLRGNEHSYDMHGNYLDAATGIIYLEQTTEILQLCGFLMLAAGTVMLIRNRKPATRS